MRPITKGPEPASLATHRCTARADYENYPDKEPLRVALVAEQRGLCGYCMSRIHASAMTIAHWHSQTLHPEEQLDYGNLLGACLGNQGQPKSLQHCDTCQGNRDLSRNPANRAHRVAEVIRYAGDGRITSPDLVFDKELNEVLNLNVAFLRNNRKATLEGFQAALRKRGPLSRHTLERWLGDWNGDSHAHELPPYSQVVVYWLRKRLARL
jgi:uncharacterized protein (TIGR02646 family)